MIFYGIVFVLLIIFALLMFASSKTWSWSNIIFMFFTFVASLFALLSAFMAFEHRTNWLARVQANEKAAEDNEKSYRETLFGPDTSLTYPLDSLRGIDNALKLVTMGAGRKWGQGTVTNQGGNAVISFSSTDGDGAAQLHQDLTVFAFREDAADTTPPSSVPTVFLGTFTVTASNGDAATMKPVFLTTEGQAELAQPQSSWTLFEKMPLDEPNVFKAHAGIPTEGFGVDNLDAYRELLRTTYLPAETVGLDPDSAQYEKLLDEYSFDGLQISEIETWVNRQTDRKTEFDPTDEHLWVLIKFNKQSPEFDVDGEGSITDGAFDPLGRAIDPALKVGGSGKIRFAADEVVLLPKIQAILGYELSDGTPVPPLIQTVDCEQVGGEKANVYRRPLKNYPHMLTKTTQQILQFDKDIATTKETIKITEEAITDAQSQETVRTTQFQNLQTDEENYQRDMNEVARLKTEKEEEVQQVRQLIQTQYKQILKMQQDLSEKADSASRSQPSKKRLVDTR